MSDILRERVACAAIKTKTFTAVGKRHVNCLQELDDMCKQYGVPRFRSFEIHGFMTTHGRFVDRIEARQIQDAAGITSFDPGGYRGDGLFSEDLY